MRLVGYRLVADGLSMSRLRLRDQGDGVATLLCAVVLAVGGVLLVTRSTGT